MRIDIEDLEKFLDFRKKVNEPNLEDLEWFYKGKKIKIPKKEITFWNYTGLNNLDFGKNIVIPLTAKASEDWKKQIEPFMKIIKRYKRITEETKLPRGLTKKNFIFVCRSVFDNVQGIVDQSCEFPKVYYDYDGIRFIMMGGQGTSVWCERIKK